MRISSNFYSGNLDCLDCRFSENIRLRIKRDNKSTEFKRFYFSLTGARQTACQLVIENAGQASYTEGFRNYKAVALNN